MKKAQVTILIIIAVVLIGIVITIYTIKTKPFSNPSTFDDPEINQINEQINNCIEERAIDAIYLIGIQGGYIYLPDDFIETSVSDVAYGLKNNRNTLPTKEEIQTEIEEYIDLYIPYCLDQEYIEETRNIKTDIRESETKVDIKENSVKIIINLPIFLSKGETTYELNKDYKKEIPIRLGKVIEIANQIIEKQKQERDAIPLTFLSRFETETIFEYINEETVIYIIHDEESKIDETSYNFMFGVELS